MTSAPLPPDETPTVRTARAARLQPPVLLGPAWGLPLAALALSAWLGAELGLAALVAAQVAVGSLSAYVAWREPPPPTRRGLARAVPLLALLTPWAGPSALGVAAAAAHAVDAGRRGRRSVGAPGVAAGLLAAALPLTGWAHARVLAASLLLALLATWWLRRPRFGPPEESTRSACPRCGVVRTARPGREPCPGCGLTLRLEWETAGGRESPGAGPARAQGAEGRGREPAAEACGEVWLACPRCRLRLLAPPGRSACPQCRLEIEAGWNVHDAAADRPAQLASRSSRSLRS